MFIYFWPNKCRYFVILISGFATSHGRAVLSKITSRTLLGISECPKKKVASLIHWCLCSMPRKQLTSQDFSPKRPLGIRNTLCTQGTALESTHSIIGCMRGYRGIYMLPLKIRQIKESQRASFYAHVYYRHDSMSFCWWIQPVTRGSDIKEVLENLFRILTFLDPVDEMQNSAHLWGCGFVAARLRHIGPCRTRLLL